MLTPRACWNFLHDTLNVQSLVEADIAYSPMSHIVWGDPYEPLVHVVIGGAGLAGHRDIQRPQVATGVNEEVPLVGYRTPTEPEFPEDEDDRDRDDDDDDWDD